MWKSKGFPVRKRKTITYNGFTTPDDPYRVGIVLTYLMTKFIRYAPVDLKN